jgi:hypothetical protein
VGTQPGAVIRNNLVYRTTHGGFHQHYGKDNVVRNTIFALGRDAQIQRTRVEDHRSFTFEHNIVYDEGEQFLAGRWQGQVVLDHNLYWRPGGDVRFGKLTWEQWRKQGHDSNSVMADPLFVAPGKGDFRLQPGSPAEKIKFKAVDFSRVGVRPPGARGEIVLRRQGRSGWSARTRRFSLRGGYGFRFFCAARNGNVPFLAA